MQWIRSHTRGTAPRGVACRRARWSRSRPGCSPTSVRMCRGCPAGCRQVPGCCPASALALPPRPRSTRRSAKGSRTTLSRGAQGDRRRLPVVPAKTTAAYSVISKVTTFLNPSIETACSSHCTHQFVRLHTFEIPYSRMRGKDAGSSRSTSKSICSSCPSKTKNCRVFHPMRKK